MKVTTIEILYVKARKHTHSAFINIIYMALLEQKNSEVSSLHMSFETNWLFTNMRKGVTIHWRGYEGSRLARKHLFIFSEKEIVNSTHFNNKEAAVSFN